MPRVSLHTGIMPSTEVPTLGTAVAETVLRVTQQDVARAAGVHNSTVSLALRGSTTISATTRDRVRRIAASMGYAPDPAVQALVAYRNRLSRKSSGAAIAFVTNGVSEFGWRTDPTSEAYFLGAQGRAAELGFHLDPFWAGESGLSQRRLNQILFHRGISGALLLAHGGPPEDWLELDWDRLSVVAVGYREVNPVIHRVTGDPTGHVRLAFRRARDAGYRRIGVVLPQPCDEESGGGLAQAVAAEQVQNSMGDEVPVFALRGFVPRCSRASAPAPHEIEAGRLAQWMRLHGPEVVISWKRWIQPHLESMGVKVPQDLALIDMDRDDANPGWAGVRQNHRAVGAVGVERVVQHLQQNVRGLPAIPTRTLIEGVWCDGATLPRVIRSSPRFPSLGNVSGVAVEASIA